MRMARELAVRVGPAAPMRAGGLLGSSGALPLAAALVVMLVALALLWTVGRAWMPTGSRFVVTMVVALPAALVAAAWFRVRDLVKIADREAAEALRGPPPTDPAGLARRAMAAGRTRTPAVWIDPAVILDAGAPGPRLVLAGVDLPWLDGLEPGEATGGPVSEPAEVGAARRLDEEGRRKMRRWAIRRAAIGLPLAAGLFWLMGFRAQAGSAWFWFFFALVPVGVWLARAGWSPVELSSAVAEPGKLTRTSMGRSEEFLVTDSAAVVMPAQTDAWLAKPSRRVSRQVWVMVVRRDGTTAWLTFDDADDAGLRDFAARWLAVQD